MHRAEVEATAAGDAAEAVTVPLRSFHLVGLMALQEMRWQMGVVVPLQSLYILVSRLN